MIQLLAGDCRDVLATLPAESVQCCVSSPPYYALRSYLPDGHADKHREIGSEPTPDEYLATMVAVFREVRRVLRKDGTLWLNIGDSYASPPRGSISPTTSGLNGIEYTYNKSIANGQQQRRDTLAGAKAIGLKPKDLLMMPARLALALQADGWWVRSDIIWHKPNPMPESCTDRPTSAHEHVYLLTRSARYYYDAEAVREDRITDSNAGTFRDNCYINGNIDNNTLGTARSGPRQAADMSTGRNLRNVWTIPTHAYSAAHFATYPPALAERCIRAGTRLGDTVLDPFAGAGTTLLVADRLQRDAIGIELNPEYLAMTQQRIESDAGLFSTVEEAPPQKPDLPSVPPENGTNDITLLDYLERVTSNSDVELFDAR